MSSPLLSLTDIVHRYEEAADWELNVPRFEVRPAELVGILGPNGSGKTTLLRLAAGTIQPMAGAVVLDGRDLRHADRRWVARRLGYLPQSVESQFDYRVEEVVAMGRYAHVSGLGFLAAEDQKAINWSLAATETEQYRRRRLSHLSGGERPRVFLASTLAQEPRVLLLDEPTRYLDIHHQVRFFRLLRELARAGMGIAVVTHDINLAALYAGRLLMMKGGRAVREGAPAEVLSGELLAEVYGDEVIMARHPQSGRPIVVPAETEGGPDAR